MANGRILVVEDERIVAKDLEATLTRLGYQVAGVVSSGEEAIQQSDQARPDLVLMDIVLKGRIDGIEAARVIRDRFDIPVIYLTAYADDTTFQRAKATLPASYLFKPFKERELRIAVELAIYGRTVRRRLQENEQGFVQVMSRGDAVLVADEHGVITFMNPTAELLTGRKLEDAFGHKVSEVCPLVDRATRQPIEHPVTRVLAGEASVELADHQAGLMTADGRHVPVTDGATPIRDQSGAIIRVILVFRRLALDGQPAA